MFKRISVVFGIVLFLTFSVWFWSEKQDFVSKKVQYSQDGAIVSLHYWQSNKKNIFAQNFNDTIHKRIFSLLDRDSHTESIEVAINHFFEEYTYHKNKEGLFGCEVSVRDSLLFCNDTLVSLSSCIQTQWGAEKGYAVTHFLNFKPSGECYTTQEIMDKNQNFLKIAEQYFRKKQNISGASINDNGFWFDDDKFVLPTNIGFTKDSVILHYNPNEIAPYSCGAITISIPMNEMKH